MKRRFRALRGGVRKLKRRRPATVRRRNGRFSKRARWSRRGTPYLRVRRQCYLGVFNPNTAATQGFWQYRSCSLGKGFTDQTGTSMGGLSNVTEYVNLFDLYKLKAYKLTFRPRIVDINQNQSAASYNYEIPYVAIKIDPTDNTAPVGAYNATTFNTFLEQTGVKIKRADRPFSVYVRPRVIEQYGAGANRYVSPAWTDLNTATGRDVEHRGYHMFFFTQGFATLYQFYDVHITYYLQFKGAK